jgi:hypothetical protein
MYKDLPPKALASRNYVVKLDPLVAGTGSELSS